MTHNYGDSKDYPESVVKRNGQYQVRYNIQETTKETEQGTETFYKYDYVEVADLKYKTLVDAMIRNKYDVNDELNVKNDKRTTAYSDFMAYVESCKTQATAISDESV